MTETEPPRSFWREKDLWRGPAHFPARRLLLINAGRQQLANKEDYLLAFEPLKGREHHDEVWRAFEKAKTNQMCFSMPDRHSVYLDNEGEVFTSASSRAALEIVESAVACRYQENRADQISST